LYDQFRNIAVVLVRPSGALNIGACARAMKNTGFKDLVLVEPVGFRTPEAFRMAVSSHEILEEARVFSGIENALAGFHATFAVTARHRHKRPRLALGYAPDEIEKPFVQGRKIALVFGPEDKGLSSEEIELCTNLIGIPAHPDLNSFNLSQAVLLVCHAVFSRLYGKGKELEEGAAPVHATNKDRQRLERAAIELLDAVDYLTPNRSDVLTDLVKRLAFRADLETRDVRHLIAIMRHIRIHGKTDG